MKLFDKIKGRVETEHSPVEPITAKKRHKYEYEVLPSAADCAPEFLFEQDNLNKVVYDKADVAARRFMSDVVLKRYRAGKALMCVLEFPKPQVNGELQFAVSILFENIFSDDPEASHGLCPYYFLALMSEGYVVGEVLTDTDDYPVVHYDRFPDADLCRFLRWSLQKSGLDVVVEDMQQL